MSVLSNFVFIFQLRDLQSELSAERGSNASAAQELRESRARVILKKIIRKTHSFPHVKTQFPGGDPHAEGVRPRGGQPAAAAEAGRRRPGRRGPQVHAQGADVRQGRYGNYFFLFWEKN